ncbi:MAG: HRDC domain-containing protein [Verrucomicrobiota bacterium]
MQLKFFRIPAADPAGFGEELNAFLRGHRILAVQRELVTESGGAWWALCVEYLPSAVAGAGSSANGAGKGKIDYREKLSAEDFVVFSALREIRKQLAERDGVPVYAVFTNEQIAEMVTTKVNNLAALRKIDGVGDSRIEKYGERFVAALQPGTSPANGKEAAPKP